MRIRNWYVLRSCCLGLMGLSIMSGSKVLANSDPYVVAAYPRSLDSYAVLCIDRTWEVAAKQAIDEKNVCSEARVALPQGKFGSSFGDTVDVTNDGRSVTLHGAFEGRYPCQMRAYSPIYCKHPLHGYVLEIGTRGHAFTWKMPRSTHPEKVRVFRKMNEMID